MSADDLSAQERAYLDAYLGAEPATSPAAEDRTWAALQGRLANAETDEDARPGERPRRAIVWWAVAAAAALLMVGWAAGRWSGQLAASAESPPQSAAAYNTTPIATGGVAAQGPRAAKPTAPRVRVSPDPATAPAVVPTPLPPLPMPGPIAGDVIEPAAPARASRPRPAPDPASNLSAKEVADFDVARRAAENGDASVGLRLLSAHQRLYPSSLLRQERQVARARALCRSGRTEQARRTAERFSAHHPRSHLAGAMAQICARTATEE